MSKKSIVRKIKNGLKEFFGFVDEGNEYEGARKVDEFYGTFDPSLGTGLKETKDRQELLKRSFSLYRDSPFFKAIIDTIHINAVGNGLSLNSNIDYNKKISNSKRENIKKIISNEWERYKEDVGIFGEDFDELQDKFFKTLLLTGEGFFIPYKEDNKHKIKILDPYNIKSGDEISETNYSGNLFVVDGAVIDKGVVKGYIYYTNQLERMFIPLYQNKQKLLHTCLLTYRIDQPRGIPIASCSILSLHRLGLVEVFETKAIGTQSLIVATHSQGRTSKQDYPGLPKDIDLQGGNIFNMDRDEELNFLESKRPAKSLTEFVNHILDGIASSNGLSREVITKSFNASYSASRASIMESWVTYRYYRNIFIKKFCEPNFRFFFEDLKKKYKEDFKDIDYFDLNNEWYGNEPIEIDPLKSSKATVELLKANLTSHTREYSKKGMDINSVMNEINRERQTYPLPLSIITMLAQSGLGSGLVDLIAGKLPKDVGEELKEQLNKEEEKINNTPKDDNNKKDIGGKDAVR